MARVNVYLPDDLADEVRLSGLNISAVAQAALRGALAARRAGIWLEEVTKLAKSEAAHREVAAAARAVRGT